MHVVSPITPGEGTVTIETVQSEGALVWLFSIKVVSGPGITATFAVTDVYGNTENIIPDTATGPGIFDTVTGPGRAATGPPYVKIVAKVAAGVNATYEYWSFNLAQI